MYREDSKPRANTSSSPVVGTTADAPANFPRYTIYTNNW
jgi:hypothetical protein